MKKIAVFFIVIGFIKLFACNGDCLSCHPTLKKNILSDERHKPMLTCIECHKDNAGTSECGEDCFACHSMKKINDSGISQHSVVKDCRECHLKTDNVLAMPKEQTKMPTLMDFLEN